MFVLQCQVIRHCGASGARILRRVLRQEHTVESDAAAGQKHGLSKRKHLELPLRLWLKRISTVHHFDEQLMRVANAALRTSHRARSSLVIVRHPSDTLHRPSIFSSSSHSIWIPHQAFAFLAITRPMGIFRSRGYPALLPQLVFVHRCFLNAFAPGAHFYRRFQRYPYEVDQQLSWRCGRVYIDVEDA